MRWSNLRLEPTELFIAQTALTGAVPHSFVALQPVLQANASAAPGILKTL